MPLQIIQRRDYLHHWAAAEAASPPTGNLRRGEIAIAIVTSDGTDTGDIVEVIGRIGPSETPTPFSDCPVVFRSPRGFKGEFVRPVLVEEEPAVDSVLAYDSANGKFVSLSEDPGNYEEAETDGDGEEVDGGELSEVAPTILSAQVKNLDSQAVVGTNPKYDLEVKAIGRPDPILSIEIIEKAWPDFEGNATNFTTTTSHTFTTGNLPSGFTLSSEDDPALASLGVRTYTIGQISVNRDSPMSRVALSARIGASNPIGESPIVEQSIQGVIQFIADPATATPEPKLTKAAISEGGSEKSKIANLATGGTTTLTANFVATGFTAGVANGTVSYQWFANGAALVGETNSTLTITNTADAYNDSQIKVDVTIADDNGTDTRSGYLVVGEFDEGFTQLNPSADSRLVYVASDGNDAEAGNNQHGRRYYLPSDPEIGGDPQNPAQPQNIKAYKTISRAVVPIRGHRWRSETNNVDDYGSLWARPEDPTEHHPDWLLFRRGQTFPSEDYATTIGGPWVSATNNNIINMLIQHGTDEQVGGSRAGYWGGRSESERAVITAWGVSDSEARPVLEDVLTIDDVTGNIAITSIESRIDFGGGTDPRPWDSNRQGCRNVLIEDCKGVGGSTNRNWWTDITIRRCTIVDASNADAHVSGLFLSTPDKYNNNSDEPPTWVIEECVFDRNGYKEDPNEPTTWTRSGAANLGLSGSGTGYQPKRTYYDRTIYGSTYDSLLLRGNIFSRGGGGGSVQMRSGGVAERNLFIWNPSHLAVNHNESFGAYWNSSLITDNCFLHFDHLLPPGAYDTAIGIEAHVFPVVIADNVFAKSHRTTGSYAMIRMLAKTESSKSPASPADTIIVVDNDLHLDGGKEAFSILDTGDIRTLVVRDNALYSGDQKDTNQNWHFAALMESNWSSAQGITGEPWDIGSNDYFSDASAYGFRYRPFSNIQPYSLSQWQAAGFDIGSTIHPSKAALSTAAGWTDPDRSILTYMQAVDPTYVVDENVYVDDDTTGQKQANRVEVWKVLSAEDQTDPHQEGVFTTADAKQIAREYHAFISFIQKARANRKGAWDSRWTADAVNNHIREGFGKPTVAGPYAATRADIDTYKAQYA